MSIWKRINRWKSALRMFQERPLLGHGPGTYMFLYALSKAIRENNNLHQWGKSGQCAW